MNRITRQAFVLASILAFITVSTAVLAHSHPDAKSDNESHCVMCMAAHGSTHLISVPTIALHFGPVQVALLVVAEHISIPLGQQFSVQGRAPPLSWLFGPDSLIKRTTEVIGSVDVPFCSSFSDKGLKAPAAQTAR
jgi:hypothetical protein